MSGGPPGLDGRTRKVINGKVDSNGKGRGLPEIFFTLITSISHRFKLFLNRVSPVKWICF